MNWCHGLSIALWLGLWVQGEYSNTVVGFKLESAIFHQILSFVRLDLVHESKRAEVYRQVKEALLVDINIINVQRDN